MSLTRIVVNSLEPTNGIIDQLVNQGGDKQCLSRWFGGIADGAWGLTGVTATVSSLASITENIGAVAAAGLFTFSSFVDEDTITVGVTVLSGETVPSGSSEFAIGATDTATAANAVACINANTTTNKFVIATVGSSAGTFLVTAIVPGYVGNFVPTAISAHGSVSGATLGTGTGSIAGTEGTLNTIKA
jgi:hypothetical protein